MEGFEFKGVIVSNGDVGYKGRKEEEKLMSVGNNHGGLVCVNNQWYMFYHRHTSTNQYNRQGCAEKVYFDENGNISQVTITTSGMNDGPLSGIGNYEAVYCCNLSNGHMGALSSIGRTNAEIDFPYITFEQDERFIKNIKSGTLIGYKYIALKNTKRIALTYRGECKGCIEVCKQIDGQPIAKINLDSSDVWATEATEVSFADADEELYLIYKGEGSVELITLSLLG